MTFRFFRFLRKYRSHQFFWKFLDMYRIQIQIEKKMIRWNQIILKHIQQIIVNFISFFSKHDLNQKNSTALTSMIRFIMKWFFNEHMIIVIRRLMNSDFHLHHTFKFLWKQYPEIFDSQYYNHLFQLIKMNSLINIFKNTHHNEYLSS